MRALRLSLVGTVMLLLLGGTGGLAVAQDEPDAPAAGEGVTVDSLTQVTIEPSDVPESVDSILLVHLRVPAGSSSTYMHNNTAFQISLPLEGELQMPVTGRTEVIRADGEVEALDTGVALRARPGDTVIGYDLSLPKTLANPAATPIELLGRSLPRGDGARTTSCSWRPARRSSPSTPTG